MKIQSLSWTWMLIAACACGLLLPGCAQVSRTPAKPEPAPAAVPAPKPVTEKKQDAIASVLEKAAAPAPFEGSGWQPLLPQAGLKGWEAISAGGGEQVERIGNCMVLNMGEPFSGVRYTNDFPTQDFEIAFDAMRLSGSDFFCGLTVPAGDNFCSLILGGWGGSLVGISSLNDMDASENQTAKFITFENGRWYRVRMRVTRNRLEAWLDTDKIVDVVTAGVRVSLRPGDIELCKPLGLATYQTTAAYRQIQWRAVDGPADPPPRRR